MSSIMLRIPNRIPTNVIRDVPVEVTGKSSAPAKVTVPHTELGGRNVPVLKQSVAIAGATVRSQFS